jgi:glycosyltransferase involved in cell wall biosynthesis
VKILLLTQYFPPEVGAPQNRLFELATRLKKQGIEIDVLTAMPNYPQMKIYAGYEGKGFFREEIGGLNVYRSKIYIPKSKGIFQRLLNYFSFVFTSAYTAVFRLKKYDYVFCESPPLFLGISALLIRFVKGSKLIFNVSDLWPESAEKLGLVGNKFLLWMSYKLEARLYKKSVLVTGQTQGICKSIQTRFPGKDVYWLPNGVDIGFYDPATMKTNWRETSGFSENDFIVMYAGIIGLAQGLEILLRAAEKLQHDTNVKIVLLGSGPEKEKLLAMKDNLGLSNVFFFDVLPKEKMPQAVAACDAAVIPLKKLDLFKGAIPSKIFENLAMQKPILLGVEGEAKELFIDEGKCGLFFEPENAEDLARKIKQLASDRAACKEFGENARKYVSEKFERNKIAKAFYEKLQSLENSLSNRV